VGGRLFYIGGRHQRPPRRTRRLRVPATLSVPPTLVRGLIGRRRLPPSVPPVSAAKTSPNKAPGTSPQPLGQPTNPGAPPQLRSTIVERKLGVGSKRHRIPTPSSDRPPPAASPYVLGALAHAKKLGALHYRALPCVSCIPLRHPGRHRHHPRHRPGNPTGSTLPQGPAPATSFVSTCSPPAS